MMNEKMMETITRNPATKTRNLQQRLSKISQEPLARIANAMYKTIMSQSPALPDQSRKQLYSRDLSCGACGRGCIVNNLKNIYETYTNNCYTSQSELIEQIRDSMTKHGIMQTYNRIVQEDEQKLQQAAVVWS